jgi:haloalkane dehalogenase
MNMPTWIDPQRYPFRPERFTTADGEMSYLDEGSGPPVLLVHGTPSWSFEWREVVTALKRTHRVIAPDHLGYGLSEKPASAPYTPADHTRRLLALVDHLDLWDMTLVVHDFGVPIGMPVALDRRERVARVVVLNGWMWSNEGDESVARIDRLVQSALGRALYMNLNFSPRVLLPSCFGDRRNLSSEVHAHYLAPFPRRRDRHALYAMAQALMGASASYQKLWARRAELTMPLHIVWGMADPAFGVAQLDRWKEAFPDAQVETLEGVGHFVAEEAPDAVVRAIDPAVVMGARPPLAPRSVRWPWAALAFAAGVFALWMAR